MNDHESDVFVVATCNDISKLPPEFARAERFDGVFFLDLPGYQQKQAIWGLYLEMFELDANRPGRMTMIGPVPKFAPVAAWLPFGRSIATAAQNVVPVAVTAAESVNRLRDWASGRCLNAEAAGIYARNPNRVPKPRRHIEKKRSVK